MSSGVLGVASSRRWERLLAALLVAQLAAATVAVVTLRGGGACTVTHATKDAREAGNLRRECEAIVPQVTAVWGSDWARRVAIVLPAHGEELARLVPNLGELDHVAAVVGSRDRVYINPAAFARLSPTGRRVVLAHEITHVASRATTGPVPTWLVEGLADYTGFQRSGLSVARVAAELRAQVLVGKAPRFLPTDAQFAGSDAPSLYQQSWLAVSLLAKVHGEAAMIRFYKTVRAGRPVDQALPEVLGITTAELTRDWRDVVRGLA